MLFLSNATLGSKRVVQSKVIQAVVVSIQACGCPLYWKAPMFYAAGGERTGFVSVHSFIATWRK